jgi:hypothetical protein
MNKNQIERPGGGFPRNLAIRQHGMASAVAWVMDTLDELTYVAATFFTLLIALAPFWVPAVLQ